LKNTRRLTKQGSSIATFTDLWNAFSAVKAGRWSKKMREDLRYLFRKHVLPIIGEHSPREITLTSLQLLATNWRKTATASRLSARFGRTSRRALNMR
jgi:hypothetical protein